MEIIDFIDGEKEAFVTFKASFNGGFQIEKSKFLKEYVEKSEIKKCLMTGSALAAKVIQKIGARLN